MGNFFKNLRVFNKIIISFMVILLITLLIGIVGFNNLTRLNDLNTLLYEKEFITVKHLELSINSLLKTEIALKEKLLSKSIEKSQLLADKVNKQKLEMIENFKIAEPLFMSQTNKELAASILTQLYILNESLDDINYLTTDINILQSNLIKYKNKFDDFNVKFEKLKNDIFLLESKKFERTQYYFEQGQLTIDQGKIFLLILIILSLVFSILMSLYMAKIITYPIFLIRDALKQVEQGNYQNMDKPYNDETGEVIQHFNSMIDSLNISRTYNEEQSWLKDGISRLSNILLSDNNLKDISQKAISFICEYTNCQSGAIYLLNQDKLNLISSYAFSDKKNLSQNYKVGEGIIGQVVIEKKPIILKDIKQEEKNIDSALFTVLAKNIISSPLVFDDEVLGAFELASLYEIDEIKKEFIIQANKIIATNIYSTIQNDKVKKLLLIAEKSQKETQEKVYEIQRMNAELEEQQQQLRSSARQMQQANSELEEQQQQLQQQTEELKQSNSALELQKEQIAKKEEEARLANTNLLNAQKELDERANQLELSNKYKSEFLSNMSHELRTPLNSIILLSQILSRNQSLMSSDIEKIKVINNAGNELLKLINDILDLSKIEAGKMSLDIREFSLLEILEEEIRYFKSLANEKNISFSIENYFNNDIKIKSDSQKISQIIRNFLSNAFKFTKEGFIKVIIEKSNIINKPIKISVRDTGIGINEEKHNIVFQAFSQADGSTSRLYGGTGLGLSIALKLADLINGEINLESKENQGSTFSLIIPYTIAEDIIDNAIIIEDKKIDKTVSNKKEEKKENKIIFDDKNNIFSNDKVVLIIEDDIDFANSVKYVNEELKLKSIIALNGKDGLDYALRYKPSAIILDLGLPDINGVEVLHELKTTRELKHIPVHIISGNDKEQFELQKNGALGFKQKPISAEDLSSILSNMITFTEKKNKKVLIVEDNAQQLMAITELIKHNNILCNGVKTKDEAIKEIDKNIYSVIVVDLTLKDGNGYDICRYIKTNKIKLPIIIYTGKELNQEEENELKKISDTIVLKTVYSGERLLDEIYLFLHISNKEDVSSYISNVSNINKEIDLTNKTILVADDDVKNTYVITAALEKTNAKILYAKNGKEAVDITNQRIDIDLILMDIMMPIMNGYEAIELIKSNNNKKHIPIIAVTAKALKDDKAKCFEVGANDYLTKPIDFDVLLNIVEKWVHKKI